ncbi:MAG: hypothetical protein FJ267_20145, partial [Planctomycetes bacterium]|nr:hypothetical protein [Planctomycetota bacterium]
MDAFNRMGSEPEEGVASPVTEEPAKKQQAAPPAAEAKKSRTEKDIDLMFGSKKTAPAAEEAAADDSDIPETIKSTKAADAFRKIKEEKAQLAKQLDELKASKATNPDYQAQLKALQEDRDVLSERVRLLDV